MRRRGRLPLCVRLRPACALRLVIINKVINSSATPGSLGLVAKAGQKKLGYLFVGVSVCVLQGDLIIPSRPRLEAEGNHISTLLTIPEPFADEKVWRSSLQIQETESSAPGDSGVVARLSALLFQGGLPLGGGCLAGGAVGQVLLMRALKRSQLPGSFLRLRLASLPRLLQLGNLHLHIVSRFFHFADESHTFSCNVQGCTSPIHIDHPFQCSQPYFVQQSHNIWTTFPCTLFLQMQSCRILLRLRALVAGILRRCCDVTEVVS